MDTTTRNDVFMENEDLILRVIKRNRLLLRALGLDQNDVYQDLAIAALDAIDSFDYRRSESIRAHIWMKLQYAVLDMKRRNKPYGMTGMGEPAPQFCSVELREELGYPIPAPTHEETDSLYNSRLHQAMSRLKPQERAVVILYLDGAKPRRKAQIADFESAMEKLREFYLTAQLLAGGVV